MSILDRIKFAAGYKPIYMHNPQFWPVTEIDFMKFIGQEIDNAFERIDGPALPPRQFIVDACKLSKRFPSPEKYPDFVGMSSFAIMTSIFMGLFFDGYAENKSTPNYEAKCVALSAIRYDALVTHANTLTCLNKGDDILCAMHYYYSKANKTNSGPQIHKKSSGCLGICCLLLCSAITYLIICLYGATYDL